ncbi:MAG: glycosyltransferase family 8 protein [Spirochaetes bacterium]|nr:glycosyltransferase family 8 protein [Spirochaetota bacterium]
MLDILVTIDSNYLLPLRVMLKSLFLNNTGERFYIHLLYDDIESETLARLGDFVASEGHGLSAKRMDDMAFAEAPVRFHYTKAMYYRLLAFKFLPPDLDRILYLDPDILVINSLRSLYETNMDGKLYAAAYHSLVPARELNRIRLYPYEIESYYNSGVLLMNLQLQRLEIKETAIFDFVEENRAKLIMPDQDIINALYAKKIRTLDEKLYNYDVRYYRYYALTTSGACDMDFIFEHTGILHFCGKRKPWKKGYMGQFLALYKQYEKLAFRPRNG